MNDINLLEIAVKVVAILSFLGGVIASVVKVWEEYKKIREAQRCQLRAEMLRTYYHNKDRKTIRQYEKQNFVCLYKAYKALKGNSFIDEVNEAVMSWEMET